MGAVTFSIDQRLIGLLTQHLRPSIFVETGTFKGDAIETVKNAFESIFTIELSKEYYEKAKLKFEKYSHIEVLLGSSAEVLVTLKEQLKNQSVIYWLDAHWCIATQTAGELSQCPLLDELHAIGPLHPESVIIIDDARLFLTAPPLPHEVSHWPNFNAVLAVLNTLSEKHHLMVWNDCIVYFPQKIAEIMNQFSHQTGIDWLTVLDKSRDYDKLLVQLKEKEAMINQTGGQLLQQLKEKEAALLSLIEKNIQQEKSLYKQNHLIAQTKDFMINYHRTLYIDTEKSSIKRFIKQIILLKKKKHKAPHAIEIDQNPLASLFLQCIKALENTFNVFKKANGIDKLETEIKVLREAATERLKLIKQLHDQLNSNKYLEVAQLLDRINQFLIKFDSFQQQFQTQINSTKHLQMKEQLFELHDYIKENLHQFKETYKKINIEHQHHIVHTYQHNTLKGRLLKIRTLIKLAITPKLGTLVHYPPRPLIATIRPIKKKHKNLPVISIITPTLNQGTFLERSILSVIKQQYPALQYIIQDGGSTDSTLDIVTQYQSSLYHWESLKDQGQSHALNKGFAKAHGEIMAYLNSDDLLLPGALEYIGSYFARHPEVDVIYGHRILIDEHDLEIGRWVLPPHDPKILSWADYVPQETLFWRRRIWEKSGSKIDESFRFAMDWDLILRFREAGAHFVRVPRFLGAFRIHHDQKTSQHLIKIGETEMQRLRERCHRRVILVDDINKAIRPYLMRHVIYHRLYRAGILRY